MSGEDELYDVQSSLSLPKEEEKILELWERIDAFQTSLKKSEGKKEYSFYDGPPFATGHPHHGHILAGFIKDIVTRYAHMTGHHVERRFGWDCHGLPIEFEIEKMLGIKTREQVLELGIANYNAECRKIVMRFSSEWRKTITRLGRWIDFDNDYKTMDTNFMESVWWVFSQLYEKDLVYSGYKVMPYSTGCTTPLSNFEVSQNYKSTKDPEVVVSFPLVDEEETSLIIWTTTPWTLPSNLAVCVHPEMEYVKIKDSQTNQQLILAKARLEAYYNKKNKKQYTLLEGPFPGKTLKGRRYKPLFNYFAHLAENNVNVFSVLTDTYVTSESGTGLVHQAPGFGEDDYRVCLAHGVITATNIPCPLDPNGRFIDPVTDYKGVYLKDADEQICKRLKDEGRLISKGTIVHEYPYCWRSQTPLIYRTVPSWFVAVTKIKDRLVKNNENSYWVPSFVQEKRFANWLKDARDWSISRTRYWGTPIPIWASADMEEIVVISSIKQLEELSGKTGITDLHREFMDDITIPSKKGKGELRRVEDVFDCWFESGSMPYAQKHYPFDNQENFKQTFPADFIAEGLDQTRGWFYTLLVLGTALFDTAPFKNLIVNGLVLAEDGQKMSKSKGNFPPPMEVIDEFGADALRLYLINSPVVRAEPLRFKKEGVKDVIKDVLLQWVNAYRFFVQNAKRYKKEKGSLFTSDDAAALKPTNVMDKWITSLTQSLVSFVHQEMAGYRLYTVVPKLVDFIQQLTNWYVRMNRKRLKGGEGDKDWYESLATLFRVLYTLVRTMAPFTPFLVEMMYQNLRQLVPKEQREDSVHYLEIPQPDDSVVDKDIERAVLDMQQAVEAGRLCRDKKGINLRQPVSEFVLVHTDETFVSNVLKLQQYVKEELNSVDVKATTEVKSFINLKGEAENGVLGPRLGKKLQSIRKKIDALTHDDVAAYVKNGEIEIEGEKIVAGDIKVISQFVGDSERYFNTGCDNGAVILMNFVLDDNLRAAGLVREVCARVQQARKKANLVVEDLVDVYFSGAKVDTLEERQTEMRGYLSNMNLFYKAEPKGEVIIEDVDENAKVVLVRRS
jgi:isoleucyl-tRNA synthetase